MSAPGDLIIRIKPEDFTRFRMEKVDVYIQNSLIEPGPLYFEIAHEGEFKLEIKTAG
jgi:hypothetical protein